MTAALILGKPCTGADIWKGYWFEYHDPGQLKAVQIRVGKPCSFGVVTAVPNTAYCMDNIFAWQISV